jgi:hypothetical protein
MGSYQTFLRLFLVCHTNDDSKFNETTIDLEGEIQYFRNC